jgi:hypothetical protein
MRAGAENPLRWPEAQGEREGLLPAVDGGPGSVPDRRHHRRLQVRPAAQASRHTRLQRNPQRQQCKQRSAQPYFRLKPRPFAVTASAKPGPASGAATRPSARVTAGSNTRNAAGDDDRITAGDDARVAAGDDARFAAGDDVRAAAGDGVRAAAGDDVRAAAGDGVRAAAGDDVRAAAGDDVRAAAGDDVRTGAGRYDAPTPCVLPQPAATSVAPAASGFLRAAVSSSLSAAHGSGHFPAQHVIVIPLLS